MKRMYRLREFFETLFSHRAIIKKLQEEKAWIEENAMNVINLMAVNGMVLKIEKPEKQFTYIIRLMKQVGKDLVQAAFYSNDRIPSVSKMKYGIKNIEDYIKKEAKKKEKKNVKANPKRQTNNKKEQPNSDKD